jgi:hypothetical protein
MTADLMLGLVRTEELDDLNQLMIVQMKNRYSDPTQNKRFTVGLNRPKMKLYDLDMATATPFPVDATNKYIAKPSQKTVEKTPEQAF